MQTEKTPNTQKTPSSRSSRIANLVGRLVFLLLCLPACVVLLSRQMPTVSPGIPTESESHREDPSETESESQREDPSESETEADWRDNGVNLFAGKFEAGGLDSAGGEVEAEDQVRSGFIPVSPATVYTLSTEVPGSPFFTSGIYEYDASHRYIRRAGNGSSVSPFTFATTAQTAYIRVQSVHSPYSTTENAQNAGYWLEAGTQSTPWEYFILPGFVRQQPTSEGMKNALERLHVFTDTVLEIRGSGLVVGSLEKSDTAAGSPYGKTIPAAGSLLYGFPYSSVRKTDSYVGAEVSVDTFLTALYNPASILYTSDYSDPSDPGYSPYIQYAWVPYGTVCSTVVSYALNTDLRFTTYELADLPGMRRIDPKTEGLQLLDIMCNVTSADKSGGHMAIVTDILRDQNGKIVWIELTDAVIPTVESIYIGNTYFENVYLETYSVYRYTHLDSVPPCDSLILAGEKQYNSLFGIDRGDVSVYPPGVPVEINLFSDVRGTLLVEKLDRPDEVSGVTVGELSSSLAVPTDIGGIECRLLSFLPPEPGYYRMVLVTDGGESEPIRFCVADPGEICFAGDKTSLTVRAGEAFTLLFGGYSDAAVPLSVCIETTRYVTRIQRCLTEEEIASGKVTIASDQTGEMYVKIYYRTPFGRIVSRRLRCTVTGQ